MSQKSELRGMWSLCILLFGIFLFLSCGKKGKQEVSTISGRDVMVKVGKETITVQDFDLRYRVLPADVREAYEKSGGGGKEKFLNDFVFEMLYAQEAVERGYDRDEKVVVEMKAAKEKVLADEIGRRLIAGKVIGEEPLREYYEMRSGEFTREPKYRISEIGVTPVKDTYINNASGDDATNEDEARAKVEFLLQAVRQGEDFSDLAKLYSERPSANRGGDLGVIAEKDIPQELKDTVLKMKVGEVSEPIRVAGTIVILRLAEKTPGGIPPFDEVKVELIARFAQGREDILKAEEQTLREELGRKYQIRYDSENISKALSR